MNNNHIAICSDGTYNYEHWLSPNANYQLAILDYSSDYQFKERLLRDSLDGRLIWEDYNIINAGKWKNLHHFLKQWSYGRDDAEQGYYWFPDPDLEIEPNQINEFFKIVNEHKLALAQPSLTQDSVCTYRYLCQREDLVFRPVDLVEIMCPCFSFAALKKNFWTFDLNYSGYGLDFIWALANVCYVVDGVAVRHKEKPSYQQKAFAAGFPDPLRELAEITRLYL